MWWGARHSSLGSSILSCFMSTRKASVYRRAISQADLPVRRAPFSILSPPRPPPRGEGRGFPAPRPPGPPGGSAAPLPPLFLAVVRVRDEMAHIGDVHHVSHA